MRIKTIRLRMSRTIRHAAYNITKPEVELEAEVDIKDDLEESYKELKSDLYYILNEMVDDELRRHAEDKKNTLLKR